MKKLLYISVNSKPEEMSTSKTVGREFVSRFIRKYPEYSILELDIYNEYIPELNARYLKSRGELVYGNDYQKLNNDDKRAVDRIDELCNQFISADVYVIAAPMWNLMFPARLKMYIDCIIQKDKTVEISEHGVRGLLDDKERKMLYIESSGGKYPKIINWKIDHGVNYLQDIFKFLGIDRFEKLMVRGVDGNSSKKEDAIKKAYKEMDDLVEKMVVRELAIK